MEISLGHLPYLELNNDSSEGEIKVGSIIHTKGTKLFKIIDKYIKENNYSKELCDFLNICSRPVKNRPKLDELTTYPFYKKYNKCTSSDVARILKDVNLG